MPRLWKPLRETYMTDLPRPDVSVSHSEDGCGTHTTGITISRGNMSREYKGSGTSQPGSVSNVVKEILNDPVTIEWLPEKKRS